MRRRSRRSTIAVYLHDLVELDNGSVLSIHGFDGGDGFSRCLR
jgi:hypothetical protein